MEASHCTGDGSAASVHGQSSDIKKRKDDQSAALDTSSKNTIVVKNNKKSRSNPKDDRSFAQKVHKALELTPEKLEELRVALRTDDSRNSNRPSPNAVLRAVTVYFSREFNRAISGFTFSYDDDVEIRIGWIEAAIASQTLELEPNELIVSVTFGGKKVRTNSEYCLEVQFHTSHDRTLVSRGKSGTTCNRLTEVSVPEGHNLRWISPWESTMLPNVSPRSPFCCLKMTHRLTLETVKRQVAFPSLFCLATLAYDTARKVESQAVEEQLRENEGCSLDERVNRRFDLYQHQLSILRSGVAFTEESSHNKWLCASPNCRRYFNATKLPAWKRCSHNGCISILENCGCEVSLCSVCHKPLCKEHANGHLQECKDTKYHKCGYREGCDYLMPDFCHHLLEHQDLREDEEASAYPGADCCYCKTQCCENCSFSCDSCDRVACIRCMDKFSTNPHDMCDDCFEKEAQHCSRCGTCILELSDDGMCEDCQDLLHDYYLGQRWEEDSLSEDDMDEYY